MLLGVIDTLGYTYYTRRLYNLALVGASGVIADRSSNRTNIVFDGGSFQIDFASTNICNSVRQIICENNKNFCSDMATGASSMSCAVVNNDAGNPVVIIELEWEFQSLLGDAFQLTPPRAYAGIVYNPVSGIENTDK